MSLRVWLPLNGDLHNQGISDASVTNSGAEVATAGKIGSCYSYNGSSNESTITGVDISEATQWSIMAWLCPTNANVTAAFEIARNTYWQIDLNGTNLELRDSSTGVSGTRKTYSLGTITAGAWIHLAITYNSGEVKIYKNGALHSTNNTTGTNMNAGLNQYKIGRSYNQSYWYNGKINDYRLYDHCLSPKEVKEIAQGLVVHYPLNDAYSESTTNIAYNQTMSWSGLQSAASGTKSGETYTVTIGALSGSYTFATARMTIPTGVLQDSVQYAVSFKYKSISGGGLIVVDQVGFDWCDASFTSTQVEQIEDYYYVKLVCPIRSSYASYHFMDYRFSVPNSKYQIWDLQIEAKDHVTPYVAGTRTPTTAYDCSGYGYDGVISGTLTTSSDSPRYNSCTSFNGTNSCITIPYKEANPDGIFTMNLWFKKDAVGTKGYETLFGGPSGFEMDTRAGTATTLSLYMASTRGGNLFSPFNFSEWYMVTMVRDGTNELYYINGNLKNTITAKSMPAGSYFIGAWKSATQQNYYGLISDFRLYATALSADDIKELYDTAASIDNGGNLHDFECVEDEVDKGQILKTGIVKTNAFVEKINYLYLPAGKFVNTQLYYENSDQCKAVTVLRYGTVGSDTRDLMGYSASGGGYWGIKANGTWEPHGTFTYTDADITKINTVSYTFSASNEHGNYQVGALAGSWSTRDKYIYSVKLYKNGTLERDLIPATNGTQVGLYDLITKTFYPINSGGSLSAEPSEAKIFDSHIEANQLIER